LNFRKHLGLKIKEIIDHLKKVAIQDFRDFFAPFSFLIRLVRSLTSAICRDIKFRLNRNKKGDQYHKNSFKAGLENDEPCTTRPTSPQTYVQPKACSADHRTNS